MATVIDSLLVKIGLDTSGFKQGQKEAAGAVVKQKTESEKWRKSAEVDAKKVTEAFTKFKKELIALTLAYFGLSRIKTFTGHLVTTGAEVLKLSSILGLSVDQLSLWEHAANKLGATSGQMGSMFEQLTLMAGQWRELGTMPGLEGDSPLVRAGLDMAKFSAETTTAEDRMLMLSGALAKLRPESALLWGQQLGFGNDMIFLLRQGPEALLAAKEAQKKLNFESAAEAKILFDMNVRWNEFVDGIEKAGKRIGIAIGPEVEKLMVQFEQWLVTGGGFDAIVQGAKDFAHWLGEIKWDEIRGVMIAIKDAAVAITHALGGIGELAKTAAGAGLGGKIGSFAGPWGRILGMLLGGAIGHEIGKGADRIKEYEKVHGKGSFKKEQIDAFNQYLLDTEGIGPLSVPARANPRVLPSAATIKPPPGTAAGQGVTSVSIGNVNVYTHATDAAGMAKGAKTALTRELSTVTQAAGGGQ
jgi:hypothetical protein